MVSYMYVFLSGTLLQIYHASQEFGTADIQTSSAYFHMANVFFRQSKMEVADSLYEQVAIIKTTFTIMSLHL